MSKEHFPKFIAPLAAVAGGLAVRSYYRQKIQEQSQQTKERVYIADIRARMAEEKAAEYTQAAAEAKEAELRAIAESRVDPLTKLANRRGFEDAYKKVMAHALRHPDSTHSFIAFDLDKFKETNDSLGHAAGDELLCQVAGILQSKARTEDTPVRFGGDEMGVLLPDTDESAATVLAERLLTTFGDNGIHASFGVAELNPHRSHDENLSLTDQALYNAKRSGGDQIVRLSALTVGQR